MKTIKEELIRSLINIIGPVNQEHEKVLLNMTVIQLTFLITKYSQLLNKSLI